MTAARAGVAVIGGSGFYEMPGVEVVGRVDIETPYGSPSDAIVLGRVAGVDVAFLPRHGAGHVLLPAEIPQRANIWALASLGVERIISVSAVGSLREEIAPLHMVVPDQLIDRTRGRASTFFGNGIVAHIGFDRPFCPALSSALARQCAEADVTTHPGGTLVVIDGPAFSTRAESELYRSWGAHIIGMTALPEAKLAREAGICYATLACVTDYDTWHEGHETVSVELVIENLGRNVARARTIVSALIAALPARDCACGSALDTAVITAPDAIRDERLRELAPILRGHPIGARLHREEALA
jgi:5'-methylthioadenosine phosphorylase